MGSQPPAAAALCAAASAAAAASASAPTFTFTPPHSTPHTPHLRPKSQPSPLPPIFKPQGLAEALRNELSGSCVSVHLAYPPDTATAGFEREQATKPDENKAMFPLELHAPAAVVRARASLGAGGWGSNRLRAPAVESRAAAAPRRADAAAAPARRAACRLALARSHRRAPLASPHPSPHPPATLGLPPNQRHGRRGCWWAPSAVPRRHSTCPRPTPCRTCSSTPSQVRARAARRAAPPAARRAARSRRAPTDRRLRARVPHARRRPQAQRRAGRRWATRCSRRWRCCSRARWCRGWTTSRGRTAAGSGRRGRRRGLGRAEARAICAFFFEK